MSARAELSPRSSPSLLVALFLPLLSFPAFAQLSNKRLSLPPPRCANYRREGGEEGERILRVERSERSHSWATKILLLPDDERPPSLVPLPLDTESEPAEPPKDHRPNMVRSTVKVATTDGARRSAVRLRS